MPWVVAKFHSTRDGNGLTITTFPSSWITEVGGKKYVLYPPINVSGSELKRLVYKGADPKGDWDLLHLKYVSPCFYSLTEALEFECNAVDLSEADLEAFAQMGAIGKRKRKVKNIRYPNEPSTSEDEDVKEITVDQLSTPASNMESQTENVKDHCSAMKVAYKQLGGKETGPGMKLLLCSGKAMKLIQSGGLKPKQLIPVHEVNELQANSSGLLSNVPIPKNGGDVDLKDLITRLDQKVTCQMESILKKVNCIEKSIAALSAGVNNVKAISRVEEDFSGCENIFSLPVDSLEGLYAFQNEIVSSPKYRRYMFQTLKDNSSAIVHKGIFSLNRTVNSVLPSIMTNRVGIMLCLKGRSPHKVSLEQNFPKLIHLIFDVVKAKKGNCPDIDLNLVKRSIGEWLRIAKWREDKLKG